MPETPETRARERLIVGIGVSVEASPVSRRQGGFTNLLFKSSVWFPASLRRLGNGSGAENRVDALPGVLSFGGSQPFIIEDRPRMIEATLENIGADEAIQLFGRNDEHLHLLRDKLGVAVVARAGVVTIKGEERGVEKTLKVFDALRAQVKSRRRVTPDDVRILIEESNVESSHGPIEIAGPIRRLKSRTAGQSAYVQAIRDHDLTICIGPAGTGKTYLAVAAALEALQRGQIKRIVLVRPAVEAGEKLGFLPGDIQSKVHPFIRPLLDALREMLDFHTVKRYMEEDVVEIAPLAFMRGRTLNDAFIILDEGQNTTIPQMKMFLTRMGMNSKIVVTGDVTQVDLPYGVSSGLQDAVRKLSRLTGVAVVRMAAADIVRHKLVEAIVRAYDEQEGRAVPRDRSAPRDGDATGPDAAEFSPARMDAGDPAGG
jgi:phosphate starvation-inducible PhoH-like protein